MCCVYVKEEYYINYFIVKWVNRNPFIYIDLVLKWVHIFTLEFNFLNYSSLRIIRRQFYLFSVWIFVSFFLSFLSSWSHLTRRVEHLFPIPYLFLIPYWFVWFSTKEPTNYRKRATDHFTHSFVVSHRFFCPLFIFRSLLKVSVWIFILWGCLFPTCTMKNDSSATSSSTARSQSQKIIKYKVPGDFYRKKTKTARNTPHGSPNLDRKQDYL